MRLVIDAVSLTNAGFKVNEFKIDKRQGNFILDVDGTHDIPCPPLAEGFVDWMRDQGMERETDELSDGVIDSLMMIQLKHHLFK